MGRVRRSLEGVGILLSLLLVLPGGTSASDAEPQILVLVPVLIHTETPEKICVQLSHLNESVTLNVSLVYPTEQRTLIQEEVSEDRFTTVPLQLPKLNKLSAELLIYVVVKGQTLNFQVVKRVLVKDRQSLVFIQTDKPIYKPSQEVKFRIAALDEDFHPVNEEFPLVYIQDPQRNRVFQWTDVGLEVGLTELSFPLPPEPTLGTYRAVIERQPDTNVEHTFTVEEYVLPKFEVVVTAPKRISILTESFEVTACGKYTYGKPVPGWVSVRVCRKYSNPSAHCYGAETQEICEEFDGQADGRGCISQVVQTKVFQLKRSRFRMEIEVEASVKEEGTDVILNGVGTTAITSVLSKVIFEKKDPYIKPGIPYFGQVKLVDSDDLPIANETIEISAPSLGYRANHTTDNEGRVLFSIDTANATDSSVNIQATYKSVEICHDWNWISPERIQAFHTASWFYSSSRSYIRVKPVSEVLKCGHSQPVQVHYTLNPSLVKEKKIVFHYLVVAKGGIVRGGSHILPKDGGAKGVFSLNLAVAPDIAPLARLLLYTILPNGEVVADSADFTVENCFANKVKLWFAEPEGLPGSDTELHISGAKGSLCAISAVDESVFLLKPEAELSAQNVFDLLPVKNLQGYHYGLHSLEEPPPPCITRQGIVVDGIRYIPDAFSEGEGDANAVFKAFGLKVFTNTKINKPEICRSFHRPVPVPAAYVDYSYSSRRGFAEPLVHAAESDGLPSPLEVSEVQISIRKYLPETWLFKLLVISDQKGSSGAETKEEVVPVTIPDTITKWRAGAFCLSEDVGFGLAVPTSLRAFQPFFLNLNLPYSVIRGEVFQLKATVFTYLQGCLRVRISLEPSPEFEASPVDQEESYCLCANERKTVSWDVTPKSLGKVNFTASAEAIDSDQLCGNEVVKVPSKGRKDILIKSLLVEAEGIEKEVVFNSLLCGAEGSNSASISLKLPANVVEDSARASFCILGDILSSTIVNLHQLLQLPYGCGEQNMALFAPNIYVLDYLNKTRQLTDEIKSKAIGYLVTGYQGQLKYRHNDGSYSTFGERKWEPGNTWLTAFVLKSFAQARKFIFIDPQHITTAQNALAIKQKENGCFQSTGTLLNNALKGGVGDGLMLSAYIVICLLEADLAPEHPLVRNGLFCLETAMASATSAATAKGKATSTAAENISIYLRALLGYAFALAGQEERRQEVLRTLDELAVRGEDGSLHWERPEKKEEKTDLPLYYTRAPSAEVEINSYVLLAYLSKKPAPSSEDLEVSTKIVRWLTKQQNPSGGFASTQDTVIALQALALYGSLTFSHDAKGSDVTLNSAGKALNQFRVDNTNRLLLQCQTLPKVPGDYSSQATGEGCIYAQTTLKYNVLPREEDAPFDLEVHTAPETCVTPKAQKTFNIAINVSYTGNRAASNMAILEIKLLSGYIAVKPSVRKLEGQGNVKRTEVSANNVLVYLEGVNNVTQSFNFAVEQETPVQDLKPAVVKIYDYYDTDEFAIATYSAPCSTGAVAGTKTKGR